MRWHLWKDSEKLENEQTTRWRDLVYYLKKVVLEYIGEGHKVYCVSIIEVMNGKVAYSIYHSVTTYCKYSTGILKLT